MNWKHVWVSIKETCIFRLVTFILNSFKTCVASILLCTFNSIILDPIKGCSIVLKFTTIINEDEGLTELSREYNSKYLLEGWIIITSFIKITMITAWICMFFTLPSDDPSNARAKVICPTIISVLTCLDESFKRNLFIKEFLILLSVFGYGWICINGNSKKDSYYIYEFWFVYYCFAHSAIIVCFIAKMKIMYENLPVFFYVAILISLALFTVSAIIISKQIKDILLIIKENKELIKTIQTILQVFPEGVMIRSFDQKTKETILKFANDIARKLICDNQEDYHGTDMKITLIDPTLETSEAIDSTMKTILNNQENTLMNTDDKKKQTTLEQLIEIKPKLADIDIRSDVSESSVCYTVKSIMVNWENNKSSILHVFIDTSEIRRLERVKAANKCQQVMFACISHEFRTPLNAFINSLQLIEMTLEETRNIIKKQREIYNEISSHFPQICKFIKIGKVSSKLLLNLIKDILDLAKFNAKTLSLNIDEFRLKEIIQELDYIFKFQCQEKGINFKIKCKNTIINSKCISDAKRIKQILINLISNSLKFTVEGEISLTIKHIKKNNKGFLQFVVYDTGIGINKEDFPKLFQMFSMLSNENCYLNKSGTGIGLSISKILVEQLGGEIKVESELGGWTKFTFTIKDDSESNEMDEESKGVYDINEQILQSEIENKNEVLSMVSLDHRSSFEEYSKIEIPNITTRFIQTKYYTKELKGLSNI